MHAHAIDAPARKPERVVSLNLCTDELLLRLADPDRVASVTWLSRDPSASNVAALAMSHPVNHGLTEEVIRLRPDVVVAGSFTNRVTVGLLRQVRLPVAEFDVPRNLDDVRRQIRQMAMLLQEPQRGEDMIADIDRRLDAIGTSAAARPTAIVLNPNGFTVGRDTLVDEIIQRAGLDNLAARLALDNYGQIPLETVVTSAVDVLIVSASRDGPPARAVEILRHPVLEKLSDRTRIAVLPSRLWNCGGPAVVDATASLKAVADEVRRTRPPR